MSINGAWGSGKSTFVNFMEYYLRRHYDPRNVPVIIRINPWWFSGHEDLAKLFLDSFAEALNSVDNLAGLQKEIHQLANIVSIEGPSFDFFGIKLNLGIKQPVSRIPKLKDDINKLIENFQTKIVVFVEDIDRLSNTEIVDLFRVVKALSDFKGVIYVLDYDKDFVSKALNDKEPNTGAEYLDKIIQFPVYLPIIQKKDLMDYAIKKFSEILSSFKYSLDAYKERLQLYEEVFWLFNSPREINRFFNKFLLNFSKMHNEVDAVDFLAIEYLRFFCPKLFSIIYLNKFFFIDSNNKSAETYKAQLLINSAPGTDYLDTYKQQFDQWLNLASKIDKNRLTNVLHELFPKLRKEIGLVKLKKTFANVSYDKLLEIYYRQNPAGNVKEIINNKRVSNLYKFDFYFSVQIPECFISQEQLLELINLMSDLEKFREHFNSYYKMLSRRCEHLLFNLISQINSEITEKNSPNIVNLITVLLEIDDESIRNQYTDINESFELQFILTDLAKNIKKISTDLIISEISNIIKNSQDSVIKNLLKLHFN